MTSKTKPKIYNSLAFLQFNISVTLKGYVSKIERERVKVEML